MPRDARLRVECVLPERLVERATARGAALKSVRLTGDRTMLIACDDESAAIVSDLCARFSIPCRVTRHGARDALRRFARRRATLPAGLALAAALCWLFLGRFWIVDIAFSGNTASLGDRAALRRALEAMSVRPGVSRSIDTELLARRLESGIDGYSYVCAHRQGIRLLVEAVPEVPAPDVYDVDAARDLVSATDGVVIRAVARSGEVCVKPGDAVRRGQLLIRGEERTSAEDTRPIAALGEVVVRAWNAGEARLPLKQARTRATGRASTGAALTVLGREFTIEAAEAYPSQTVETRVMPVGGLFLPVQVETTAFRETETVEEAADIDALKARAAALALSDAALRLSREGPDDYEIARTWVEYETTNDALIARAVYEIHTDAAVSRKALQGG